MTPRIPRWLYELTAWAGSERWILWVFALLVVVGLVDLVQRRLVRRLAAHADRTRNIWDDVVVAALGGPVSLLIWVLGAAAAASIAARQADAAIFDYVVPARTLGVVVVLAWFALRLVRGLERGLIDRYVLPPTETGPDRTTIEAFGKLLRAAVTVTAVLVAMQSLGFSISGVVAFGGVGGIAVGFAARDLLANFFGSIMIHLDRPLAVGDWIRSPDREIEGTVEYIGWRLSRIRTFDMRPLYVPNSVFASVVVENPSRMSHRRIHETVGIRYADIGAMEPIVDDIRSMLEAHEAVDEAQPLIVNLVHYGASSLDVMVYCLVTEKRWAPFHRIKQEIMLAVSDIIARHGAEIAYPTSTLHVASLPAAGSEPEQLPDRGRAEVPRANGGRRIRDSAGVHGDAHEGSTEGDG